MIVSLSSPANIFWTSDSPSARAIETRAAFTFAVCRSAIKRCSDGSMPEISALKSFGIRLLKSTCDIFSHSSTSWLLAISDLSIFKSGLNLSQVSGVFND